MLGRGGLPLAPPSKRAEAEELFVRVRAGESINDYETVRQRKDGTLVAVSIAAAPVRDGSGQRRRQHGRLHRHHRTQGAGGAAAGADRLLAARARGVRPGHAHPAVEPGGRAHLRLVARGDARPRRPADGAACASARESEDLFARVLGGESINDHETVRQRKDGTLVAVSIAAAPVRDGSGRVVGNMVAYTDITDRKAQEAEVHRLNDELHARLEELAASRARIVTAGDVERRRLERNLHDGAQQRLVALSLALRVALAKLDSDPAAARATLTGAGDELALALAELRELARGLHPAVLTDRGLRAAVEMLAGRSPVPVEIADIPAERLPEPVEAAAYYLIAEALTNVAKYAEASDGARPGCGERRERLRRSVGRRRRRRGPVRRLRPPGPGGPRRGAGRLARGREPRRRRDVPAGRDPGQTNIGPPRMSQDPVASIVTVMLVSPGPALSSATRGMSDAARRMDTAAHNVANLSTDEFAPLRADGTRGPVDSMDIVQELVDATMLAPFAYTANATVARTAAEMQRALLDIRA